MLEDLGIWADALLGLDQEELGAGHMALRAVVVYVVALVMVRWGEKRFMGKSTAFDDLRRGARLSCQQGNYWTIALFAHHLRGLRADRTALGVRQPRLSFGSVWHASERPNPDTNP